MKYIFGVTGDWTLLKFYMITFEEHVNMPCILHKSTLVHVYFIIINMKFIPLHKMVCQFDELNSLKYTLVFLQRYSYTMMISTNKIANPTRRSPISIAAAVIYIITQLSDDKKPLKGL